MAATGSASYAACAAVTATFKNPAEKDAAKQTLYMFYALNGNFIGANFTGK